MAPYFIFALSTGSMILLGSIQRLELIKHIERHIGRERRLQVAARWQKEAQERSEKLGESLRKLCTEDDTIGRAHKTWGKI
jgi:chloride channel 2